jgi:hypothetical protein
MAALYTTTLTYPSTLTITRTDNVTDISILAIGGIVDITGSATFKGLSSAIAKIPSGTSQTFIFQAPSPCDYLLIAPESGASASITIQQP